MSWLFRNKEDKPFVYKRRPNITRPSAMVMAYGSDDEIEHEEKNFYETKLDRQYYESIKFQIECLYAIAIYESIKSTEEKSTEKKQDSQSQPPMSTEEKSTEKKQDSQSQPPMSTEELLKKQELEYLELQKKKSTIYLNGPAFAGRAATILNTIDLYSDNPTDEFINASIHEKLLLMFYYIATKHRVYKEKIKFKNPNIFHFLAQGKMVTNRTGENSVTRDILTLSGYTVKFQAEIAVINKLLSNLTSSSEQKDDKGLSIRDFLLNDETIQEMLNAELSTADNTPIQIANRGQDHPGKTFIKNIYKSQVSTGGKSRRSIKHKTRARKSKKSNKSRKTARK